jgi:hypothetical protein
LNAQSWWNANAATLSVWATFVVTLWLNVFALVSVAVGINAVKATPALVFTYSRWYFAKPLLWAVRRARGIAVSQETDSFAARFLRDAATISLIGGVFCAISSRACVAICSPILFMCTNVHFVYMSFYGLGSSLSAFWKSCEETVLEFKIPSPSTVCRTNTAVAI